MKYGDKSEPTPLPAETPFALEPRVMTTRTITVEALAAALPENLEPFWDRVATGNMHEGMEEFQATFNVERFCAAIFAALPAEPAGAGLREALLVNAAHRMAKHTSLMKGEDGGAYVYHMRKANEAEADVFAALIPFGITMYEKPPERLLAATPVGEGEG